MLAATTTPVTSLAANIWGLLSNVFAAGIGAAVGGVCTYFAIKWAYKSQIVNERRLDDYLRLARLLSAACGPLDDWPQQYAAVNSALSRVREHCAAHTVLLDKIAADFIRFYDEEFSPWYENARGTDPTHHHPPGDIPSGHAKRLL